MTNDFTVTCTLTPAEEARAKRADILRKQTTWIMLGAAGFFLVALFSPKLFAVLAGDKPLGSLLSDLIIFSVLGAVCWLMFRLFPYGFRAAGADMEVTVSSEGVSSQSPVARRLLYWVNFTSALEIKDFILLRAGEQSVWVVPKRGIGDPATLQGLRDLIRAHVSTVRLLDQPG